MDTHFHLATDMQRGGEKTVERVVDRTFSGVLDGHHAEIGNTGFHLVEDLLDGRQRQRTDGVAELLEHGLLGEGALGAEESHLERFLLGKAGRHDFAEQTDDFLVTQGTTVAG